MTDRQRRILLLAADGHTTTEIAEQLFISLRTVKDDLLNFKIQHNLRNRTQAVAYAIRQGWI